MRMAMDYKDYYKILGIPKTATEKEIKAAYRKLARQHHPDVNQNSKSAEDKFKDVGEAYEVLSDPDKRGKYDQYGDQWKAYSQAPGGFNPGAGNGGGVYSDFGGMGGGGIEDLLSSIFGGQGGQGGQSGGFGGFNSGGRSAQRAPAQDVEHPVQITLEEAFSGTSKSFTLNMPESCSRCSGSGAVSSGRGKPCTMCGGTGKVKGNRGFFGNNTCPQCGGTGQELEVCPECQGDGTVTVQRKLRDIKIPPGISDGQRIRLSGQGPNGADLYLKISVRAHANFERNGDDLATDFEIPYTVAALGGDAQVQTFSGPRTLHVPAGTQSGQNFRVGGEGMPSLKTKGTKGNLIAKAKVIVPKTLGSKERELLMEIAKLREEKVTPATTK